MRYALIDEQTGAIQSIANRSSPPVEGFAVEVAANVHTNSHYYDGISISPLQELSLDITGNTMSGVPEGAEVVVTGPGGVQMVTMDGTEQLTIDGVAGLYTVRVVPPPPWKFVALEVSVP